MNFSHHLIIDFEATCCNDYSFPREEMEIIEIGAAMIIEPTLETVGEFQTFIRPIRHPQLIPFCTKLTTISQLDVDTAPFFKEAIASFSQWLIAFKDFDFCSWGNYDRKQLEQDCRLHAISSPLQTLHRNLKQEFSDFLKVTKHFGISKALKKIGLPLEGTHHRGIDDARNIAKIFKYMEEKSSEMSKLNTRSHLPQ